MYELIKREILESARKLDRYGIIKLSAGNLSVRCGQAREHVVVTPSGMEYADLNEGDMVVMEADTKKIVEGFRKPSVDIDALLHIYHNLAHVNAVIHTHQNYATCIGLVYDRLPSIVTTLANAAGGEIRVAPFSSAASLEMGKMAVAHIGDKKAVILRNHGVVVVGKTLKEAVYSSVYLEDAALIYCVSKSLGKPVVLTEEQTSEAVRIFEHYIQTSLKNS